MDVRKQIQERFQCCGFQGRVMPANMTIDYPSCDYVDVSCLFLFSALVRVTTI